MSLVMTGKEIREYLSGNVGSAKTIGFVPTVLT